MRKPTSASCGGESAAAPVSSVRVRVRVRVRVGVRSRVRVRPRVRVRVRGRGRCSGGIITMMRKQWSEPSEQLA